MYNFTIYVIHSFSLNLNKSANLVCYELCVLWKTSNTIYFQT